MGKSEQASKSLVDSHWLSIKVAALILLAVGLILIPMAWMVGSVLRERLMRQTLEDLQQQDQAWLEQLRNDLRMAETSIHCFVRLLSNLPGSGAQPDAEAAFQNAVQRDADGIWRSRPERFQATLQAGIWAPDEAVDTPEERLFFVQAKELMETYGLGSASHLFANTWALPEENGEIVYWPEVPDFIYQVPASQDYRPTEWYQLTNPDVNPSGEPRWTSTSYDPVPKVWMISVVAPFQRGGRWAGAAGHDLIINDLFRRIESGATVKGGEVVVLDRNHQILVASRHQAEIEAAHGQLKPSALSDQRMAGLITKAIEQSGRGNQRLPGLLETRDEMVAFRPLDRPDWLVVHILPRMAAREVLQAPLRWLNWGMAITTLVLIACCGLLISHDTVRRMRAEQELRESNAVLKQYESFINQSPAVLFLWRTEPAWAVEFASENVTQLGYRASDFTSGRVPWSNLLRAQDLEHLEAEVERHRAASENEFTLVFQVRTARGELRWMENRTRLIRDEAGHFTHVQGIMLDITERRHMEEALRSEELRHQILFNHSGVGIVYFDCEGRLQMMNETARRNLRQDLQKIQGAMLEEFLPPALATVTRQRLEHSLQNGQADTFEDEVPGPGGSVWFVSTFTCIRDREGRALGVQVVSQDITSRKQMEAELAESEVLYRTIVETTQEGVWTIDQAARTLFVNQRMAAMLGYGPEEMAGRPVFDFVDGDSLFTVKKLLEKQRENGVSSTVDLRLKHKTGTDVWTMVSTNALTDEQGRYTGSLALVTDITERRRAEQDKAKLERQIQQAQRLESLGIMAAGIAHDFNNLLQAILGHSELAMQESLPGSPQQESLREIQKAAQHAGVISNQMLSYIGQGHHQRKRLNLPDILQELKPTLLGLADQRALLTVELDPDLPQLLADPAELKQALVQLTTNAVEAQGEQPGRITMRVTYRPWRHQELRELFGAPELFEGPYLTITVSDNGIGIDRAAMQHLFEPFFSTKFPGRGLGLMNVLGFARGHGGGIKVESMPGHGSTFTLVLPEAPPTHFAPEPTMPWGWRGNGTIIMVDDEAAVLNVGRRMLTELGFNVITAGDGREALQVYRAQQAAVRCVMLDLMMPDLDGAQTLSMLRDISPELPVIIATAYPANKAAEILKGLTYQGIVHKPYQSAAVARLLQSLLG